MEDPRKKNGYDPMLKDSKHAKKTAGKELLK